MQTKVNSGKRLARHPRIRVVTVIRGGALVGGAAVGAALLTDLLWTVVRARAASVAAPGPSSPADLLTALTAGLALGLLLWLVLVTTLAALAVVPGAVGAAAQPAADRLTPLIALRVIGLVLGTAVVGGTLPGSAAAGTRIAGRPLEAVAAAADDGFAPTTTLHRSATPARSAVPGVSAPRTTTPTDGATPPTPGFVIAPPVPSGATATPRPAPDPRFVPTRPRVRPVLGPGFLAQGGIPHPDGVVVHRGDTLWSLAARQLGPDATDAEIAVHWPRWYAANRAVIGPDPDLIRPGQVLVPPSMEPAR